MSLQLSYFHARLALLLHIAQSRLGATAVLTAGLFHSVKLSGLFAIDPELGVGRYCRALNFAKLINPDIEDPDAAGKLYELLVAIARVICAVVLSRGPQNEQTLDQARKFLAENRLSVLTVLKKSAGLAASAHGSMKSTEELADSYTLLMSLSGFIDVSISSSREPLADHHSLRKRLRHGHHLSHSPRVGRNCWIPW